ncbi:hypothetical protein [Halorubellus sp. PRR65]|uniref:hypothetical protein n=1 Tax=Halorubellus sp. PRR65 TaxID=3098148 RepID=UPI002B260014|nr:hypothetical protein [Halorubellus sp. PRR65]
MPAESSDPRTVDVLVVHADDVVAALAATAQGRETVLRVTPPFRRRQRARIHVPGEMSAQQPAGSERDPSSDTGADPLVVPADAFVDEDAPSFPRAPETEPEPAESPEYDVDEHLQAHEDAVAAWRERIQGHFRERARVDGPDDERCEFDVRYLGARKQ